MSGRCKWVGAKKSLMKKTVEPIRLQILVNPPQILHRKDLRTQGGTEE